MRRDTLLTLIVTCAIALPLGAGIDRTRWTGSWDGVKYVQTAESLLAGRGLVHMPFPPTPYENTWEPLSLWPPGYPWLIASAKAAFGGDASTVAVWIARIAWWLLPAMVVFCLRPLDLGRWAVVVGFLVGFSPGAISRANTTSPDVPFLVMVLGSLGLAFAVLERRRHHGWMLLSGLAAGAAFALRNAGIALLIALPLGLIVWSFRRRADERSGVGGTHVLTLWMCGALAPTLAVLTRCLLVFGRLQPYEMPPSKVGLVENTRWLVFFTLFESTGIERIAWVVWNGKILVALALGSLAILWFAHRQLGAPLRSVARGITRLPIAHGVLLLYAALTVAVHLYGRTRYEWGVAINERYTIQFVWILIAFAALWARSQPQRTVLFRVIVTALVAVLFSGRATYARSYLSPPSETSALLTLSADRSLIRGVQQVAEAALVLSDNGPFLTAVANVSVRHVFPAEHSARPNPFADELEHHRAAVPGPRSVCFIAVGPDELRASVAADLPAGFQLVTQQPLFVVLCTPSAARHADFGAQIAARRFPRVMN